MYYGTPFDTVVAYKADADIFCPACAALIYDRRDADGVLRTVGDRRPAFRALDNEGNEVSPILSIETNDMDPSECCGRCHQPILEEYDGVTLENF